MIAIYILAGLTLLSSAVTFAYALMSVAVDPDKTFNPRTRKMVEITDQGKRVRFIWYALGALLPMALAFTILLR